MQAAHPTARETYVGCSLYVRGVSLHDSQPEGERGYARWFDASGCYLVAARALSEHTIDRRETGNRTVSPRFCPPENLNLSVHDVRPLASAYLAYFEHNARKVADRPAFPVFLQAMTETWPCR
jgi:Rap1a immunity proteins